MIRTAFMMIFNPTTRKIRRFYILTYFSFRIQSSVNNLGALVLILDHFKDEN